MKVKLIKNPWVGNDLPDGLTMNKIYEATSSFDSNIDTYFYIIDDNGDEVSWYEGCFEIVEEPRSPDRIDLFLEKFKEVWKKQPDMRFYQLIYKLSHNLKFDPFYAEESDWLKVFDEALVKSQEYKTPTINYFKEINEKLDAMPDEEFIDFLLSEGIIEKYDNHLNKKLIFDNDPAKQTKVKSKLKLKKSYDNYMSDMIEKYGRLR